MSLPILHMKEVAVSKQLKQEDARKTEDETAEAILSYLAEQPRASDTLEGIAEWWIMRHQVRVEVYTLRRILSQLTSSGVLTKIGDGDEARYHLSLDGDTPHS
ncbi:MAG: hypothetical protein ACREOO_01255 [bacterium]